MQKYVHIHDPAPVALNTTRVLWKLDRALPTQTSSTSSNYFSVHPTSIIETEDDAQEEDNLGQTLVADESVVSSICNAPRVLWARTDQASLLDIPFAKDGNTLEPNILKYASVVNPQRDVEGAKKVISDLSPPKASHQTYKQAAVQSYSPPKTKEASLATKERSRRCGLGITFSSAVGDEQGRVIKRIKEGGPAAESKLLAVGDCVLSVNEICAVNLFLTKLSQIPLTNILSAEALASVILGRRGTVAVLRVRRAVSGLVETVALERFESRVVCTDLQSIVRPLSLDAHDIVEKGGFREQCSLASSEVERLAVILSASADNAELGEAINVRNATRSVSWTAGNAERWQKSAGGLVEVAWS